MSWLGAWQRIPTSELVLLALSIWLSVQAVRSLAGSCGGAARRSSAGLWRDEKASATLDFTLVFPLFTMVILILAQLALLINARLVVSYAAFASCRSAVVWLEQDEDLALKRAQRAAEVGCVAISPGSKTPFIGWLHALPVAPLYLHDISPELDYVRRVVRGGSKFTYSKLATSAEIILPEGELGPHDPVTVEVEHRFYLSVPYADRIFRDSGIGPIGLPVRTIRDVYTLTNEGRVQSR